MKPIYKLITIVLLLSSFALGYFAISTSAVAPLGFGGRVVFWFPCTCSYSTVIYYKPTFPTTLKMASLAYLPEGTLVYSLYNIITYGTSHLGQYLPGVQACYIYVGYGCALVPNDGVMIQLGTSGFL